MKAYAIVLPLAAALVLTACGGGHEKVHAVDRVEAAAAEAAKKAAEAPKPEPVIFDDDGKPTFVELQAGAAPAAGAADAAKTDAAAPAADAAKTDASAPAADAAKADAAPADAAKTEAEAPKADAAK